VIVIPVTTGSPSLASFASLESALGYPLTKPRIGYHSYTRDLTSSSVTVSSESADGPKDSPLRPDTFEFWQATSLPATWKLSLGTTQFLDYVGIASHNIGTKECTVLIETSIDGSQWREFSDSHTPTDDSPILFLDEERQAAEVRVTLSGGSPTTDCPMVSVIYVGQILKMEHGRAGGTPIPLSRETVLRRNLSRSGQFLGQTFQRNGLRGSASFRGLTPSWYRTHFDPFVESARRYPFFFAWNPQDYTSDVVYAWATGDISPQYMGTDPYFEVSWNMQAINNGD
jgi:hypothetical protein